MIMLFFTLNRAVRHELILKLHVPILLNACINMDD